VTYRLRKLRDKGILPAIYYFVHAERASISKFFIFVYCRSWSAAFHQKFFRFCQANGHIVALLEVVGSWRYEVIVRLEEPALITALVEGIQREFSGFIAHTTYVPYYNEPKVSPYPFKSFELIKSAQQRF
jgi:DNA-binding Lrp family transcriptional regulator